MKKKRLSQIEDFMQQHKKVSLKTLCDEYNVSISTLRRDLDELERQGVIQKSYGYVLYSREAPSLIPFHVRSGIYTQEKKDACAAAASLICDNDTIFVDSGSTVCHILDYLEGRKNITIVTNNLDVILRAISLDNIEILVLSGVLNRKNNSFSPISGVNCLEHFNFNKAFMAASAFSLSDGFSHSDPLERPLKQAVLSKACKHYFVLDEYKFGEKALLHLCPGSQADAICTNKPPSNEYINYCNEYGILLIAGPSEGKSTCFE